MDLAFGQGIVRVVHLLGEGVEAPAEAGGSKRKWNPSQNWQVIADRELGIHTEH